MLGSSKGLAMLGIKERSYAMGVEQKSEMSELDLKGEVMYLWGVREYEEAESYRKLCSERRGIKVWPVIQPPSPPDYLWTFWVIFPNDKMAQQFEQVLQPNLAEGPMSLKDGGLPKVGHARCTDCDTMAILEIRAMSDFDDQDEDVSRWIPICFDDVANFLKTEEVFDSEETVVQIRLLRAQAVEIEDEEEEDDDL